MTQVEAGVVNHHNDTANAVSGIKSAHVLDSWPDMHLKFGELTCSCDSCQGRSWEPADVGALLTARPPCTGAPALFDRVDLEMRVADPARRLRGTAVDTYLFQRATNEILAPQVQGAIHAPVFFSP